MGAVWWTKAPKCCRYSSTGALQPTARAAQRSSFHERFSDEGMGRLAAKPQTPITLADLVRHGRPPLSPDALVASANHTLNVLPSRLAHRIQCLRNLPFIVVTNQFMSRIYDNYLDSLSRLLMYRPQPVRTLEDEQEFTKTMIDLVRIHNNTIPVLAKGLLECKSYLTASESAEFLEQHLRARIGTRLVAEQHIALHLASQTTDVADEHDWESYIGVIKSGLRPVEVLRRCERFVAEICELKYGVRPSIITNGDVEADFAYVPGHIEYILTELLKNAFRAMAESDNTSKPVEVTIAAAPDRPVVGTRAHEPPDKSEHGVYDILQVGMKPNREAGDECKSLGSSIRSITMRIRDQGGGIAPETLPNIWRYNFTTFHGCGSDEPSSSSTTTSGKDRHHQVDGLSAISGSLHDIGNSSSLAGLGYGLPLSRAYAEFFGGSIEVESLHGFGTDVYVTLNGLRRMPESLD